MKVMVSTNGFCEYCAFVFAYNLCCPHNILQGQSTIISPFKSLVWPTYLIIFYTSIYLQLNNPGYSFIIFVLALLLQIGRRASAAPTNDIVDHVPIPPADDHAELQLLNHYARNDAQQDVPFVLNRQRRASNSYGYPDGYAPVDGFFEGPNRGEYTQPARFQGWPSRFDDGDDGDDDRIRSNAKYQKRKQQQIQQNYQPVKRQEFVGPQGPPPPSPGNKYVYQPLFKYKATHHKHHKLFVPNIFGWCGDARSYISKHAP